MKRELTLEDLKIEAKAFCEQQSKENHVDLIGVTDGKAVGTYIEQRFEKYLESKYVLSVGNSSHGIDLPGATINTDIKTTSIKQPQSSCPYKNAQQKIFGLGYNLLVFVYDKKDTSVSCTLKFVYCTFIEENRTGDFTVTKRIREMVDSGANDEDLVSYLNDTGLPGDEITYQNIAERILEHVPEQGYLTISKALQWRLAYKRVVTLENSVDGVTNYEWK